MSSSNDTWPDNGTTDLPPSGEEQDHAGHSGEGAASALAHLKNQTRQQQRRQALEHENPSAGPGQ